MWPGGHPKYARTYVLQRDRPAFVVVLLSIFPLLLFLISYFY